MEKVSKENPVVVEENMNKVLEHTKDEDDNQEVFQVTSPRVRLDSYVNIEYDEALGEKEKSKESAAKKLDVNTNFQEIAVNTKKDRCKSLSDLFPCGVCAEDLGKRYKGKSVLCMGCMHWCHLTKCSGLSGEKDYKKKEFRCPTCINQLINSQRTEDSGTPKIQGHKDCSEKNYVNKNHTEIKKPSVRKVSFYDNSPIITGGREFPETRRKRKNREGTPDSLEKKTDEEKSPISKKTKVKDTKKNDKITKNDKKPKEANNQQEDEMESMKKKKGNKNLLEYQGTNITSSDISTLDNGQWVCDEIIALFLAFMREDRSMKEKKILLVNPSTAFILKECEDKKLVQELKSELKINEMEWVFYPVNNNKKANSVGGTHWSLLMYCRKENLYYHYDPIEGTNIEHAKKIVLNTLDMNHFGRKGLPEYKEIKCPQQENTYDCGPYIMMYIQKLTDNIISDRALYSYHINKNEVTKFREQLQDVIQYRISKSGINEVLIDETKNAIVNKVKESEKEIKLCSKWARDVCSDKKCTFDHPELCRRWITKGDCLGWKSQQCKYHHPALCWQYLGQGMCNNGHRCDYRHIHDANEKNKKPYQQNNRYTQTVCRYWASGKCTKYNCSFTHPVICQDIVRTGLCSAKQCKRYHPQLCNANLNNRRCRWGDSCRFRHINNVTKNEDYLQQNKKPNMKENPQHYLARQNHENGRGWENQASRKYDHKDQYEMQLKTKMEDFLWSRLDVWEKKQMMGMMTHTMEERRMSMK